MIVTTHRFVVPSPRFFVCKKRSRPEVFRSAAGRRVRAEAPRLHLPLTTFSPPSATCDSPAWRWGSIRRCVETPVRLDPSAARPLLNFAPVQRRWRVSPDAWWPKPPCVPGFASPSSFPSRRLVAPSGICFSHAVTALSHAVAAHRVRAFRAFPTLVALERFPVHCPLDITSSKARKKMVAWTTLGAPRSDPVLRWASGHRASPWTLGTARGASPRSLDGLKRTGSEDPEAVLHPTSHTPGFLDRSRCWHRKRPEIGRAHV